MPRRRLGVALLLPEPAAQEVDGLRRACGDGALGRVPPHLTLVPPVNVREDDLPRALTVLREAATTTRPFTLRLGPPATFLPTTPTLHLAVGGEEHADRVLRRLRDAVFRPPLERPLTFPFVPHVTLADGMDPERIAAARTALADFVVDVRFEWVHLLQEQRGADGVRRWEPVADAPLAPPVVVGRGGVELDLLVGHIVDPEALRFEADAWPVGEPGPTVAVPSGAEPLVVVVRRRGAVVGLARGWHRPEGSEITTMLVGPDQRGQGIARQVVAAFEHAARSRSARPDDT